MSEAYEIDTDGRVVWINGSILLGRFSRYGIDVHVDGACVDGSCRPGLCGISHWKDFKSLMKLHHEIVVDDKYMPEFLVDRIDQ